MLIRNSRFSASLWTKYRNFSTILSTGEKVEREMTALEREIVNVKESQFSKLGLFKKNVTNEASLYKLFQMAQPGNKTDYSACLYAVNHFYNFGLNISHYDFTNRWLATAVETGRVDEAVSIVKLWNTWLPCPPRIEFVESLMGMVKVEQSRELLKAIRENWQMPLSARAYTIVIAKQLAKGEAPYITDGLDIWRDAVDMGVVLPNELGECLASKFKDTDPGVCEEIRETLLRWSPGGSTETN